jgi:alcohol dehydrogenase class IV
VEATYAQDGNRFTLSMARDGLSALSKSLPVIAVDTEDSNARLDAMYGAWLCGMVLRSTSMGLHHKLCHVLGGRFGLPHAETHAVILPHAVAFNSKAAPAAMAEIAAALGSVTATGGIFDICQKVGAPTSLREIGMPEEGLEEVSNLALAHGYLNPRPIDHEGVRALVDDAWYGRPPREAVR